MKNEQGFLKLAGMMLIVEHCIRKGLGQRKNLEGAHHNYYINKYELNTQQLAPTKR